MAKFSRYGEQKDRHACEKISLASAVGIAASGWPGTGPATARVAASAASNKRCVIRFFSEP